MPTSEQIEKAARAITRNRYTAIGNDKPGVDVDAIIDRRWHHAVSDATAALSAAEGVKPRVKPLDLSNLLKHAFFSGYAAATGKDEPTEDRTQKWVEYDPDGLPQFARILSALEGE